MLNRLSTTSVSISHFVRRACELARIGTFKVASVIEQKPVICIIYFRNVLHLANHLKLILAFYDYQFGFFIIIFFFAIFNPKFDEVTILGFYSYTIPTVLRVILTHSKKSRVILNNSKALNSSQRQTLVSSCTTRLRKMITKKFNGFFA